MRADVASMPASDVVQLVLWPDTLAAWTREAAIAPAVAYNMLSRFKPYRRVRELLALRLDVPTFVVDHLIDAPRPLPIALRAGLVEPAPSPSPPEPPGPVSPTLQLPARRDGSNPIERRAAWHIWHEIAALPASVIVQLAIYPETLADWARRRSVGPSMVYGMLAGTQPHPGLREALARRLDVATPVLAALLDSARREARRPSLGPLADVAVPPAPTTDAAAQGSERTSPDAPDTDEPPQLALDF